MFEGSIRSLWAALCGAVVGIVAWAVVSASLMVQSGVFTVGVGLCVAFAVARFGAGGEGAARVISTIVTGVAAPAGFVASAGAMFASAHDASLATTFRELGVEHMLGMQVAWLGWADVGFLLLALFVAYAFAGRRATKKM